MISFVRALSVERLEDSIEDERKPSVRNVQLKALQNPDYNIDYDGETELFSEQCKTFMGKFVDDMFLSDGFICQEDKAKFGLLVQHSEGRGWFGKFIELQRTHGQEVDEFTFYRLVQYFAIALFECNVSDDFAPATSIMNMCFTYFFTSIMTPGRFGQPSKQYVYEYLKDQPIWKSERFWNATFLHAIHNDRMKRTGDDTIKGWNVMSDEQRMDFEVGEVNSSFAHLASFLYMMKSFEVSKKERDVFRQKMCVISNLNQDQIHELEDSVEIVK